MCALVQIGGGDRRCDGDQRGDQRLLRPQRAADRGDELEHNPEKVTQKGERRREQVGQRDGLARRPHLCEECDALVVRGQI
jgi:hypothetical protein